MGTASPRITRMLAVESLVPTRHTRSRVRLLIPILMSLGLGMMVVLLLANLFLCLRWSFRNLTVKTHDYGRIGAKCILRCLESVST